MIRGGNLVGITARECENEPLLFITGNIWRVLLQNMNKRIYGKQLIYLQLLAD